MILRTGLPDIAGQTGKPQSLITEIVAPEAPTNVFRTKILEFVSDAGYNLQKTIIYLQKR